MRPRIVAFYLPQFHTIPENDEWWGKGFTDWTNVKKGKKLFKKQEQPRIPLDNNYYDPTRVETLQWQARLMNQYGVYGLCFYHYWFNGKLLLEKPAEQLLAHAEIPMRFCMSWANEPWARTWDGKNSHVLMPQEYGTVEDWRKHFDYLLPFFKDERYIKVDGCPMFLLYKSTSIPQCKEMMDAWNVWAQENGFPAIHFVETMRGTGLDSRDLPYRARVEFEPIRTNIQQNIVLRTYQRVRRRVIKGVDKLFHVEIPHNTPFAFSDVADRSCRLHSPEGSYAGAFVGWDNTARKGLAGTVVLPPSKEEFEAYLKEKIHIMQEVYHTDFLFINAWNEWAEGTYLEPDTNHGYDYLEVIKKVVQ